jgi:hypothetical protein
MAWLDSLLDKLQALGPLAIIALLALAIVVIALKSLGLIELLLRGKRPHD